MIKPSEVLEGMDWIQGSLYQEDLDRNVIGCCALGAVELAEDTGYAASKFWKALRESKDPIKSLSTWNDSPERTKGEVIALLKSIE